MTTLFFDEALLPEGWAHDVTVTIQGGAVTDVETGTRGRRATRGCAGTVCTASTSCCPTRSSRWPMTARWRSSPCCRSSRVFALVRDTDRFKFNVNLVLIDLFLRRGLIDPASPQGVELRKSLDGSGLE